MTVVRIILVINGNKVIGGGAVDGHNQTATNQEIAIAKHFDDHVQQLLAEHAKSNHQSMDLLVRENPEFKAMSDSTFPSTQTE